MTADEASPVPLYLCCAEDNEVSLVRIVDALHRKGYAPEVLAGVESDGSLLSNAVDRATGTALFLLCQTEDLDRSHIRRLEGLFSARRGPRQKLVTVRLDPGKPLTAMAQIQDAVDAFRAEASKVEDEDDDRGLFRDVVGPTKVSAIQGDSDPEHLARQLHDEMVAAEAMLTRRARSSEAAPYFPAPDAFGEAEPGAPSVQLEDEGARGLPSALDESESQKDLGAEDSGSEDVDGDSVAVTSGVEVTQDRQTESDDELEITGPTPRSGSHEAAAAHPVAASEGEPPMNRFLLASGVVGIATLAVIAIFYLGDEPEPNAPRYPTDSVAAQETPQTADPQTQETPTNEAPAPTRPRVSAVPPSPSPPRDADGKNAAKTPPSSAAEEPPKINDSASDEPNGSDDGAKAASKKEPARDSDPAGSGSSRNQSQSRSERALEKALADGSIKEAGRLLMTEGRSDTQTWSTAQSTCRSKRVGGVIRSWRLPTAAQVKQLAAAGVLDSGTYWTGDMGETEDEAYAVDASSGARNLYLTQEPIAKTVCVRRPF